MADLLPDRLEIFVLGRDFLMLLEAAILQDAEESISLVDRLTAAVQDGPDADPVGVDLLLRLVLRRVLESR